MILYINGHVHQIRLKSTSIRSVLDRLKIQPEHVMVSYNNEVFKGTDTCVCLKDQDALEVVHFVGGGALLYRTS